MMFKLKSDKRDSVVRFERVHFKRGTNARPCGRNKPEEVKKVPLWLECAA